MSDGIIKSREDLFEEEFVKLTARILLEQPLWKEITTSISVKKLSDLQKEGKIHKQETVESIKSLMIVCPETISTDIAFKIIRTLESISSSNPTLPGKKLDLANYIAWFGKRFVHCYRAFTKRFIHMNSSRGNPRLNEEPSLANKIRQTISTGTDNQIIILDLFSGIGQASIALAAALQTQGKRPLPCHILLDDTDHVVCMGQAIRKLYIKFGQHYKIPYQDKDLGPDEGAHVFWQNVIRLSNYSLSNPEQKIDIVTQFHASRAILMSKIPKEYPKVESGAAYSHSIAEKYPDSLFVTNEMLSLTEGNLQKIKGALCDTLSSSVSTDDLLSYQAWPNGMMQGFREKQWQILYPCPDKAAFCRRGTDEYPAGMNPYRSYQLQPEVCRSLSYSKHNNNPTSRREFWLVAASPKLSGAVKTINPGRIQDIYISPSLYGPGSYGLCCDKFLFLNRM